MSAQERAVQQRDPLAALVGRPTSYLAGLLLPVYAGIMTWLNRDSIVSATFAIAALLFVAVASLALVLRSSPLRAPLTARTHALVVGSALAAMIASDLSMWGSDPYLRDNWGAPAVGLFIVALAPYRPARELMVSGLGSAFIAAFVALVRPDSFVVDAPVGVFVVVAATPILAMSLGAAAFVDVLVRSLDRWRVRADRVSTAMSGARGDSIARSVQQDSVTVLNQEVVPFFTALLEGAVVDEETRQRARAISNEVRALMVADVDRTWLESVVEQAGHRGHTASAAAGAVVTDEQRLAEHMSTDERTALRAFIVALHDEQSLGDSGAEIAITPAGARCDVVLRARLDSELNVVKGPLAPFLAVVRVMFGDLQVEHEHPELTLRFSYEQR
ncbi:hypothetical protein GCM10027413_07150 [Conyzicola nivalis]|uniref:Uncharacterized protein n=1 Tax=Conyzicola nivalis TaxID=1477021 RepID=A0A916SNB3_9MICO|nr:hypothetical protein [Conyzicola nivalis]GGB04855.1 hypothetical protein GCM10010979_19480 [Conyzicola nivalis]